MPKISVIMSVYKEPVEWIKQSIQSILVQTLTNFEFIIICDNPEYTDCIKILRSYSKSDSRIKLVFNETNIGLTKSLNKGIQMAKGEYIVRMDADDVAFSNRLQAQVDFLEKHPDITIYGSNALLFGNLKICASKKLLMPDSNTKIRIYSIFLNPMIHPSVIINKKKLGNLLYNDLCKRGQDYELWVRLMSLGHKLQNSNLFLLKYRRVDKGVNYFNDQNQTANIARVQSLANVLGNQYAHENSDIHLFTCSGASDKMYSVFEVEVYLKELLSMLLSKYPNDAKWIRSLVGYIWQLNCIRCNAPYNYFKSSLFVISSAKDILKMLLRLIINFSKINLRAI